MLNNILLWILLLPSAAALGLLLVSDKQHALVRKIATAATGLCLLGALYVISQYNTASGGYQFAINTPWITSLGINFHIAVDGISALLVLLHALCGFTGVLVSYSIKERVKEYYIFYLTLITGVFGVFMSADIFFFYFFYEMAVIPMYPLIGIWGSDVKEKGVVRYSKQYATMKLTIYLTAGAVLALIGLLWLYVASGANTFDMVQLQQHLAAHPLDAGIQKMIFPLLLIGFGVIAPMWPLHSWSPMGHAAAPSAVSMLHAGVLMKLGSYAIIRLGLNFVPEGAAQWLPWVASLCVMNIIYGGFVAMSQRDLKLIIGYSSSSHMGYVLLGIACLTPIAVNGAILLMFAHGVMTALSFAIIGQIYDQTHTRYLPDLGGLAHQVPFIAGCGVIAAMASSGLPGFANFVSELLVFVGGWEKYPVQIVCGVFGVVITAVYMLRVIRGTFFGPEKPEFVGHVHDARGWFEKMPYLILIAALMVVGCWPKPFIKMIDVSARPIVERITGPLADAAMPHEAAAAHDDASHAAEAR